MLRHGFLGWRSSTVRVRESSPNLPSLDARARRGTRVRRPTVLGAPAANKAIDSVQGGFWEAYRWVQRIGVTILDEGILNNIENGVDAGLNVLRATPAEEIVD